MDVTKKVQECYQLHLLQTPAKISLSQTSSPRIESVNAVFMQAAFEDEFGPESIETEQPEPPTPTPTLPATTLPAQTMAAQTMAARETNSESNLESESPNEYYRWDSSPWSVERIAPLPSPKIPREFPLRDDGNKP